MRAKVLVLLCKWRVPWRGRRPARQGLAAPRGGAVTGGGQGLLTMAAPFSARRPRRLKRSPAWRQGREASAECRGFGRPWEDGNRGRAGDKAAAAAGAASRADAVCRGRRAPRPQRPSGLRPGARAPRGASRTAAFGLLSRGQTSVPSRKGDVGAWSFITSPLPP